MMNSKLQKTTFSVEKIRNVVNVGNSTAYQIYTTPGEDIGYLGNLELSDHSSNDASYTRESPRAMPSKPRTSWFKKSLTAFVS